MYILFGIVYYIDRVRILDIGDSNRQF